MAEALPVLLKELRLPAFARHYLSVGETARQETWSHADYLSMLCEREVADRYQRRVHKWTREAQLPTGKTFTTLKRERLAKTAQGQLATLQHGNDWALRADNVILVGPSGTGKTHVAAALGHVLIEQGVRCRLFPAIALVQQLQQAKRELELMSAMTRLDKYRVVIIDDIGYVKKSDAETQVLFEFIAHRYESASLIITANQPFSAWDQIFPDAVMTVAAIDHLIHHASIIEFTGESYRKHARMQNTIK
jgi:DNA replication protein DnaC